MSKTIIPETNFSDFDVVPKLGRGIIISNPLTVDRNGGVSIATTSLDPIELRRSLLFWNHLVWPMNNVVNIGGGIEADFLESCGVLSRPKYNAFSTKGKSTNIGSIIHGSFLDTFEVLDGREPGQWCMSQGSNSILFDAENFSSSRGILVELRRSVPIPDGSVPLEEVLRFKESRKDELLSLNLELDGYYQAVVNSSDKEFSLRLAAEKIEKSCLDLLRVSSEDKNVFRLSSMKFGWSLNAGSIIGAGQLSAIGAKLAEPFGFEGVGALVGGAASFLGLSQDFGRSNASVQSSPFRVLQDIHEELR